MGTMTMAETMTETGKGERLKLEIRRVIRASRERVFAAWTQAESIQKWFGPSNVTAAKVEADVQEGGTYRIETASCDAGTGDVAAGRRSAVSGTYLKVTPNSLLRFTWRPEWSPSEETVVTVEFYDADGGTELVLKHEGFVVAEQRDRHEQGWTGTMVKLAEFLER
jgi:uncharacterized protein YndB with AHSA1/START domain